MKTCHLLYLVFILSIIPTPSVHAQTGKFNDTTYNADDYDIMDGLRRKRYEKLKQSGDLAKAKAKQEKREKKKVFVLALPFIGYNPFLGLAIGAGANISFRMGDPENTNISVIVPSYTWTTNRQNIARVNTSLYTSNNNYYIFSSALWSVSPQATYGLGGRTLDDWQTVIEPSTFKFLIRGYRRVWKELYVGLNFNFDWKYAITDNTGVNIQELIQTGQDNSWEVGQMKDSLNSEYGRFDSFWTEQGISQDGFDTDYYTESSADLQETYYPTPFGNYPYGTKEAYIYSGAGVNVLWDSRDNTNSSLTGAYANVIANYYPTWLGSTYESGNVYIDLRYFQPLSKNKRQIIAFWGLANLTFGDVPYVNLPRIGGDDWFSSGRGYTAARFIGQNLLYLEAEYRVNIWKWFGMTAFVNAHMVTEEGGGFSYVTPAGGIGVRIKAIKKSRTNICIDYGIGINGSSGLYVRLIEAF